MPPPTNPTPKLFTLPATVYKAPTGVPRPSHGSSSAAPRPSSVPHNQPKVHFEKPIAPPGIPYDPPPKKPNVHSRAYNIPPRAPRTPPGPSSAAPGPPKVPPNKPKVPAGSPMAPQGIRRVPPRVPEFPGLAQNLREDTVEHLRQRVRRDLGRWIIDKNNAIQKKVAEIQEVFDEYELLHSTYYEAVRRGLGEDLAEDVYEGDLAVEHQLFSLEDVRGWLEQGGSPEAKAKDKCKDKAVENWVAQVEAHNGVESPALRTPSSTLVAEPPPGTTGGSKSDGGEETPNREERLNDIGLAL
jgi:hypothetical protein